MVNKVAGSCLNIKQNKTKKPLVTSVVKTALQEKSYTVFLFSQLAGELFYSLVP